MSELRCPCGGAYGETVVADRGYAHRRCLGCGLLGMDPRAPEGDGDYGEDYWADKSYQAQDLEGHRWWFCERVRG